MQRAAGCAHRPPPCPSNKSYQSRGAWPLSDPGFYFIGKPRDSTSSELNAFWERRWLFLFEAGDMGEAVGYAVDGFQLFLRDQFSDRCHRRAPIRSGVD